MDEQARQLQARVQTLESDKRDTMEALDRKSNDYDQLQEDYTAAQQKVIEGRREISALESRVQQAESAQSTAKFRTQNLEQEIDLLKKNNEWLDSELKTKISEYQKFRKEKAAQVSTLRSELDEALSTVDISQRSLDTYKDRLEEANRKAEDRLAKIKELEGNAAQQEENFRKEVNAQRRLAELYGKQTQTARARVMDLEKVVEQEHERNSVELGQLQAALDTERAENDKSLHKIQELEREVERLEADVSAFASGAQVAPHEQPEDPFVTPRRRVGSPNVNGTPTPSRPGSAMGGTPGGTPGGLFTPGSARMQKRVAGMSITQLYSDYTKMKAAFENEKRRNQKLEDSINELIGDMEEQSPAVQEVRNENERLQKELIASSQLLETTSKERDLKVKEAKKVQGQFGDFQREQHLLKQQLRDLSLQVQVLLVEIEQRDAGAEALTAPQNRLYEQIVRGELDNGDNSDTDQLITQRLVVFRTMQELQQQNSQLLGGIRELGQKMEQAEAQQLENSEVRETEEIKRLATVIETLKDDLRGQITKSESLIRERDMFRRMLQSKGDQNGQQQQRQESQAPSETGSVVAEMQNDLREALRQLQSHFDDYKTESSANQTTLNEQIRKLSSERTELEIQVAKINSQLEMAAGMLCAHGIPSE